ncbi:MAG: hypothetical protein RIA08_21245 [Roseovarius sp.]|uniref:hypothetical protein n=1 Tax=Roseovarius sp. TaxID=1486281 RepID=UPI0032ECA89D
MPRAQPIRLLIILAPADAAREKMAGPRLETVAAAYYLFRDREAEVVLATPAGGDAGVVKPHPDRSARLTDVARFLADRTARDDLADTLSLSQIVVEDFDTALCLGNCGGPRAGEATGIIPLLAALLCAGRPVGVIPGRGLLPGGESAANGLLLLAERRSWALPMAQALYALAAASGAGPAR